ncbi:MAG: plasmid pRiA4b ORF-3 family protein [Geminicoccaceae bacterium]
MASAALVLKITLCGLRPPVWRRVRVSADSSLRMLHLVIQAAMGWQDYHLHEFEIGDRRYGEPDDDPLPGDEPTHNESNVKLGALLERGVERFRYVYDFGDGWEHEIVVEKVEPLDPEQPYPSLITGKRACPPEDCGGVHGYLRLLEVLADPTDEEHAELKEWAGDDFDPERFDADTINAAFAVLARRRRSSGGRPRQ